ncbi:MAG: DUF1571 domain-containing protein [Planctomycetota bacterium]|nr:DUF1571 domain-containing protein [Planctomycetota bacterium]
MADEKYGPWWTRPRTVFSISGPWQGKRQLRYSMFLKQLLRPTNRRIRLLVGLLLVGLFCIQCTRTEAFRDSKFIVHISGALVGNISDDVAAKLEELAKTDHIALLEYCHENYQHQYRDYTCTLIKQERINGTLRPEQWISSKFMDEPFSVALKWTKNAPIGEQVIFVKGKYNDQMLVRPKGLLILLTGGPVLRKPDGDEALKNTLRPVNQFGFECSLENLLNVYRQAKAEGDLKESFGGYAEIAGRKAVVLVRYLPAENDYPACKTLTYIDVEYLLPICVEGYDWDDQLSCRYLFKDIKFNVGLGPDDFTPEANGLTPPK